MPRPIKILHCLGTLNPGGVQNWLLLLLKSLDRKSFQFDFCTFGGHAGLFAPEVEKLGAKVLWCPISQNLWKFSRCFREILRQGQYDVVHSHVHAFSGVLLRWARLAGVRIRVAHSHNSHDGKSSTAVRRTYRFLMKRLIRRHSTHGLAASREAACDLFIDWKNDRRIAILHYGIDLKDFRTTVDSNVWRAKIGLPLGPSIVGHVGNFVAAKNHVFFLAIAAEILKRRPNIHFLLIGDGPLRAAMEARVNRMGLRENTHFLGTRTDVPFVIRACMDAFVFPSLWEGLPISLIEAQAAGLPCVFSSAITEEVYILPQQIVQLPLSLGPEEWAKKTLELMDRGKLDVQAATQAILQTGFSIDRSLTMLTNLYSGNLPGISAR